MLPDEIEAWYVREKERITDEYIAKLKATGNKDITKVHAEFEPKYKALIKKYNDLHTKNLDEADAKKKIEKHKKNIHLFIEELKNKIKK